MTAAGATAARLGFQATDRVAIVHCDDIGMCHAANEGAFEALTNGPATCGSLMVPCPWFEDAARRARERPEIDLGVHLTLNAEWPHYRWGPVAGPSAVPSLVDASGRFPRTTEALWERARPEEAHAELRAQVERALSAGVDVTHLDSHMGACFHPSLLEVYAALAREFDVPVMATQPDAAALRALGLEGAADAVDVLLAALAASGVPLVDAVDANSLHFTPGDGEAHNRRRLAALPPGVSYLICHPARGGAELSAITEDAHMRDFERGFYGGEAGRRALAEEGIHTAGMRALRELMREAA